MRTKNILAGAAGVAVALALASLPQLQAAALPAQGAAPHIEGLAQVVKAKRHTHHAMRMHSGRHARSKRPGSCGENMYFSRKAHHCLDARDKA